MKKGEDFGYFIFDELSPIITEEEGSVVSVNQIHHVSIKLHYDEIKGLQQEDP